MSGASASGGVRVLAASVESEAGPKRVGGSGGETGDVSGCVGGSGGGVGLLSSMTVAEGEPEVALGLLSSVAEGEPEVAAAEAAAAADTGHSSPGGGGRIAPSSGSSLTLTSESRNTTYRH